MRNYDEAIDKKLITKESLGLTYKHCHQPLECNDHAQGSGKDLFKSKKKIKY